MGFCDPAPGSDKELVVLYSFKVDSVGGGGVQLGRGCFPFFQGWMSTPFGATKMVACTTARVTASPLLRRASRKRRRSRIARVAACRRAVSGCRTKPRRPLSRGLWEHCARPEMGCAPICLSHVPRGEYRLTTFCACARLGSRRSLLLGCLFQNIGTAGRKK